MGNMSLQELRSTWEQLGEDDPLWAVLSDPARRGGRWNLEHFMATGRVEVADIVELVRTARLTLGKRVLDFGCGVGRLSVALAEVVSEVVGVDIASSMIAGAQRLNREPERVRFVHYDGHVLPFADNSFDSAVSLITVQHMPSVAQLRALLELQRVVRPGGALVLQIPGDPRLPEPLPEQACRAGLVAVDVPPVMAPESTATVRARVVNKSGELWPAEAKLRLGNHWRAHGELVVRDDGRVDLPHTLRPGDWVDLDLLVRAPAEPGDHELELDIVQELVAWWADVGGSTASVPVRVDPDVGATASPEPGTAAEPQHPTAGIEMHGIPSRLLRDMFAHCGHEVRLIQPNEMAGADWESYTYVLRCGH